MDLLSRPLNLTVFMLVSFRLSNSIHICYIIIMQDTVTIHTLIPTHGKKNTSHAVMGSKLYSYLQQEEDWVGGHLVGAQGGGGLQVGGS